MKARIRPDLRLGAPVTKRGRFAAVAALLIAVVLVSATAVPATTHRVPSVFATIDAGIQAAEIGDTVLVAPGVYTGPGNKNLSLYGKDIVLLSEAGPEQTIIDVAASFREPSRGILIDGGETAAAVVDGFTIINGFMSTQPDFTSSGKRHDLSAGGFKVNLRSRPTIRNMIVRNCHSEYTGGGISIEVQSAPTLINCVVTSCSSGIQGGGISIESGSAPVVENCVFTGNRSVIGGGMACDSNPFIGPTPLVQGCTIAGNFSRDRGGGVFCNVFSKTRFERLMVWGNCSGQEGPELSVETGANVTLSCSLIDSSRIFSEGVVEFLGQNMLDADPLLCAPDTCTAAPSSSGDYGVGDESPCLGRNSPCGERIGAIGRGACGTTNPVVETSWGKLKGVLGRGSAEPAGR